jgi:hypothetical protein
MSEQKDFLSRFMRRARYGHRTQDGLVRRGYSVTGGTLPTIYTPLVQGVDLEAWVRSHAASLRDAVTDSGGILFRGFEVMGWHEFEAILTALAGPPMAYVERSSPRRAMGGRIYSSTEHPADQTILLHCESSYAATWPGVIAFYCEVPATRGGATPLADMRRVRDQIPAEIRAEFAARGLLYLRNYGGPLGMGWQEAFQTSDRATVEEYCTRERLRFDWRKDGIFSTSRAAPAFRVHPRTGEPIWFNHATFFHPTSLPEPFRSVARSLPPDKMPATVTFGDGMAIGDEIAAHLRAAYAEQEISFAWQRGDILVLDNLHTAHGRDPFEGQRSVIVGMAEPQNGDSCPAASSGELREMSPR